ncbi:uncharacterized protein [Salminus brasiliensis]|uniref:uncharacterized protein n=1 Tax=Salminus brasiliensis TaxID=930266 RepID=UPI003B830409
MLPTLEEDFCPSETVTHYLHLSCAMIQLYAAVLLSMTLGATTNEDIDERRQLVFLERLKFGHVGENISLICSFTSIDASAAVWFKQIPGEKPLVVVSVFRSASVKYHNGFNRNGRFIALKEKNSFTLNISQAKPSDSATYYCAAVDYSNIGLGTCTVLVLEDHHGVVQQPVLDPVELGGNTTLQCSILTERCSGDHSVYWFRHGSGESHPGIIYTHGNRSDECKKSSETGSSTQSCVYNLPKRNLSLSDAGTYYCAVAACGEILFGNGTKLDFVENSILDPTIIVLAASNIISVVMVLFLCRKLHNHQHRAVESNAVYVNQAEDPGDLNYAALSITQASFSRRSRTKNSNDQPVYAQVKNNQ